MLRNSGDSKSLSATGRFAILTTLLAAIATVATLADAAEPAVVYPSLIRMIEGRYENPELLPSRPTGGMSLPSGVRAGMSQPRSPLVQRKIARCP
jgi:hypothetical protein